VLVIAAVLARATSAFGVEIGPVARVSTMENAVLNAVEASISIRGATIDEAAEVRADVTFANIGRPMMLSIRNELMRSASIVILSGLLTEQAQQLAGKAASEGSAATVVGPTDGWSAVLIQTVAAQGS
jgi:ribosomal protein L11 methylase PrmA